MKTLEIIPVPPRNAVDVFKLLPEGTLCEVINNAIYMSPSPTASHQRMLKWIFKQLDSFVELNKSGEVFFSALDVFLDDENVFQPDLIFISSKNTGELDPDGGFHGVPDLIVEVLSTFNKEHDLVKKKLVYEKCGVKEYWVIDPEKGEAMGFELKGRFFHEFPKAKGKMKSLLLKKTFSLRF
ncbi:MAG: Uma2 family endonuclease [Chitinophagaceae bacterium]|nr:Uma2 family endonuclease [Chitinophagaceae bacterium]